MSDKPVVWVGSARRDIQEFPEDARSVAGFELRRVQHGLDPTDWKPMTIVGPGVREIRIRTGRAHRVFYLATFAEAVYVLHVFDKKTQATSSRDIQLGRERFKMLVSARG
jgi:phage-related protein